MHQCRAKSKRSGERCKNYAVRGYKVCRMHGARGGAKTPEGKARCKTARLTHGFYTEVEQAEYKMMREQMKAAKQLERHVSDLICPAL